MGDYDKGWEIVAKLGGKEVAEVLKPQFAAWGIEEFIIGDFLTNVVSRPQLDLKTREFCTLSALLALGAHAALDFHFNASLNVSSIDEVRDLIIQTYFISGFAKTVANFQVFDKILEARKEIKGEEDLTYKDKQTSVQKEEWKKGTNIGEKLLGDKMWEDVISEVEAFDLSVAEYFSRDIVDKFFSFSKVLSTKTQLLCLIAALTVLDNMPQLKVAVLMAVRAGCTHQEVKEVILQMSGYHGWPIALNAIKAFQEVTNAT